MLIKKKVSEFHYQKYEFKNKIKRILIKNGVSPFVAASTVCKSCVVDFVVAGDE